MVWIQTCKLPKIFQFILFMHYATSLVAEDSSSINLGQQFIANYLMPEVYFSFATILESFIKSLALMVIGREARIQVLSLLALPKTQSFLKHYHFWEFSSKSWCVLSHTKARKESNCIVPIKNVLGNHEGNPESKLSTEYWILHNLIARA